MSNSNDDRILSCGHKPSPHSDFTTGTAHLPAGVPVHWVPAREVCWDCSLAFELHMMRKTGKVTAYLVRRPDADKPGYRKWNVTTWPGQILSNEVEQLGDATGAFRGRSRQASGFYIRFVFDGFWWSGYARGEGMYLRARRTKRKA